MKNRFLAGAAAAIALLSTTGVAHADNVKTEATVGIRNETVYFGPIPIFSIPVPTGAIYSQSGTNTGNDEAATPTVTQSWAIKGAVQADCSYYDGGSNSHTLDFGTIGVVNNSNTTDSNIFNMRSAAAATATTTTAGCNTKNSVTITKANGSTGLKNAAATGYDSTEFQANIPYSAEVKFTGTTNTTAAAAGASQTLTAAAADGSKTANYGAWRSGLTLSVNAPVPSKALVAGNYSDTLTVELKAI